jgi:hypothetical protein
MPFTNERIEGKTQLHERLERNERIDRKTQLLERLDPEREVELEGTFTNQIMRQRLTRILWMACSMRFWMSTSWRL